MELFPEKNKLAIRRNKKDSAIMSYIESLAFADVVGCYSKMNNADGNMSYICR